MTAAPFSLAALRPHERAILCLKALIGAATSKTVFLECLNRLRLTTPAWSTKTLSPVLESLRAKRLLTDALACPPELLNPLAVEAIASPDGPAMVKAVRACLPPDTRRYWDARALEADTSRWLRLAVHLNDEAEFKRLMELRGRYSRNAASPFDEHFAAIAVGTEWFASRSRAFQFGILVAKADRWIATGIAAPDYP